MLLCKNKFQYKCMSCEMFPSVSQITYDVSEKQCLAKIEINAHFFPTLILLIMHALRALRKRRFALFKESKCCMVGCNKLTSRGASLTRRNLY